MSLHLTQPSGTQHSRRSPSVNTFSTASSIAPPAAYRTSSSSDLRRSISSRSGGGTVAQPSSYAALLRKQKATVWCDRAQYEDPRVAAQQRAAKMRAHLEVFGSGRNYAGSHSNSCISATGKVATKIRHHGKMPVVGYAPGENHVGVGGVPVRLSATEVEGGSSDEDDAHTAARLNHRRTGSSERSSTASGRRGLVYRSSSGQAPPGGPRWSSGDTPDWTGSPADPQVEDAAKLLDDAASGKADSSRSGSSAERAENVTELGSAARLASNSLKHSALSREKSVKSADELRRRGSVDDRTATLTSGRLFIANPD